MEANNVSTNCRRTSCGTSPFDVDVVGSTSIEFPCGFLIQFPRVSNLLGRAVAQTTDPLASLTVFFQGQFSLVACEVHPGF